MMDTTITNLEDFMDLTGSIAKRPGERSGRFSSVSGQVLLA